MSQLRLKVREIAKAKRMSMMTLSHKSYAGLSTIRNIYRDPYRPVSTNTLKRLADALEVPILDLIEEVSDERMAEELGRLAQKERSAGEPDETSGELDE